jgi:Putative sperm flagellar membrane protein
VYDLKGPSSKVVEENAHPHRSHKAQPTGVITTMIGTVVREGLTTVHETKVVGTFVSGKYTQVLQSTSTIKSGPLAGSPAIRPSPSLRILKTAAPLLHQHNKVSLYLCAYRYSYAL